MFWYLSFSLGSCLRKHHKVIRAFKITTKCFSTCLPTVCSEQQASLLKFSHLRVKRENQLTWCFSYTPVKQFKETKNTKNKLCCLNKNKTLHLVRKMLPLIAMENAMEGMNIYTSHPWADLKDSHGKKVLWKEMWDDLSGFVTQRGVCFVFNRAILAKRAVQN